MFNILLNIPTLSDATSFYRAMGPLSVLKKQYRQLNFSLVEKWNWASISGQDLAFFQRPYHDQHMAAFKMAKDLGLPIWVDFDDYLLGVPGDNPTFGTYNKDKVKNNVITMLKHADVVTVSTHFLKNRYEQYNKNIRVIPNCFNPFWFSYRAEKPKPRNNMIVWRGSHTHHRDVMTYSKVISEVHNANPEVLFHYIGDNLWFLTESCPHKSTIWSEAIDPIVYHEHIYTLCPKLMHVPLHDSPFNRAKSNIAWIEGSFAGAATLAPDWPEWKRPGVLNYKNQEDYKNLLSAVIKGEIDVEAKAKESWEDVCQNFNLFKWNKIRADVIGELLNVDLVPTAQ